MTEKTDRLAHLFLPEKPRKRLLVWATLPPALFLVTHLFFSFALPNQGPLWSLGLALSLLFNTLITYLSAQEVAADLTARDTRAHNSLTESHAREAQAKQEIATLHEELKRWKEEAEQRRIEKATDEKRLALVQTELTRLLEQKDKILTQAMTPHEENLYKQLRTQFAEKSHTLDATRKELFHMETTLLALQLEEQTIDSQSFEKLLSTCATYEEMVDDLEGFISQILSQEK